MTKFLIGGLIAATAAAVAVPAMAQQPTVKSRAEVAAAVTQRFARIDASRDGFISKAEADARQARRGERHNARAGRRDPAKMFARLDANRDGNISRAEAVAARTARAVAKGKPADAHAVAFGNLFERADKNRDGTISRTEYNAAPPVAAKMGQKDRKRDMAGGRMFARGDANNDGRVSLAEAQQAAVGRFDRLDLNRDGQVTPAERDQARQQRRANRQPG